MKAAGIILARKGSIRIKNKNLINFKNHPIDYWTMTAAIKSKIFNTTKIKKVKKV